MKKIFSLFAAVLFAGSMMADDVVISGRDFAGQGTVNTGSEVSATVEGVTFTCDKAYSDDEHATLRCYKNGNITITAPEKIGKLVFQFYSTYNGGLDTEVAVNANEWNYALPSQARIEQVTVVFGDAPVPVVTLDTVNVAKAVEIGMALDDNAKTTKDYVVAGYVVKAYDPKEDGSQTWFMADEAGAFGEFEAYFCTPDEAVAENDFVYVKGKIQKYVKEGKDPQIEISNGTATHGAPQGIENITLGEKAQKVMVDGVVYVIRDNKMFDLLGNQVR